jgi:glutathione S-transferase
MIRLYHCVDARSFRPLWALEEVGVPYELHLLPFPPRVLSKAYLDINPLGTIPAFFDGETAMTESSAIVEYVAVRYGADHLAVAPDHPEFGRYLNYLHFGEATLTFPQTLVLRYTRLEPRDRRQPQVAEDYRKWFLARLRGVERALAGRDWLCADRFTGADISVGYALLLAQSLDISDAFSEPVAAYWARLQCRDGFQRAKAAQAKAAGDAGMGATIPLP